MKNRLIKKRMEQENTQKSIGILELEKYEISEDIKEFYKNSVRIFLEFY